MANLLFKIRKVAVEHKCKLESNNYCNAFEELVMKLSHPDKQVVILIDEYGKPLLSHFGKNFSSEIQTTLKNFYSVIKSTEEDQRFVLLTGGQ